MEERDGGAAGSVVPSVGVQPGEDAGEGGGGFQVGRRVDAVAAGGGNGAPGVRVVDVVARGDGAGGRRGEGAGEGRGEGFEGVEAGRQAVAERRVEAVEDGLEDLQVGSAGGRVGKQAGDGVEGVPRRRRVQADEGFGTGKPLVGVVVSDEVQERCPAQVLGARQGGSGSGSSPGRR